MIEGGQDLAFPLKPRAQLGRQDARADNLDGGQMIEIALVPFPMMAMGQTI